jgi:hypothetical protein
MMLVTNELTKAQQNPGDSNCQSPNHRNQAIIIIIILLAVVLVLLMYSPLLGLGRFFSFFILNTVGKTPWKGDQPVARPLPTHGTA